jgi:hypothetical protein
MARETAAEAPATAQPTASPSRADPAPSSAPADQARLTYVSGAAATPQSIAEQSPAPAQPSPQLTLDWVRGNWRQVGIKIRALNPQVQGLINSAGPIEVHGNTVRLGCVGKLVCDKLADPSRRELVERVLSDVLGVPVLIECVVCDAPALLDPTAGDAEPPPSDLFAPTARQTSTEEQLLNHPAVKELQKRGGKISHITVKDKQEDKNG